MKMGGCLHPLSAPFLGCAGNKTPIIPWMASNSRWGRPALQLTPPDPSPSVTGFPTPRCFICGTKGLGGGERGALPRKRERRASTSKQKREGGCVSFYQILK